MSFPTFMLGFWIYVRDLLAMYMCLVHSTSNISYNLATQYSPLFPSMLISGLTIQQNATINNKHHYSQHSAIMTITLRLPTIQIWCIFLFTIAATIIAAKIWAYTGLVPICLAPMALCVCCALFGNGGSASVLAQHWRADCIHGNTCSLYQYLTLWCTVLYNKQLVHIIQYQCMPSRVCIVICWTDQLFLH